MRRIVLALVSLLAAPLVGAAQEAGGRQWIGMAGPEGASLIYGTPQSDDIVIAFACDRATKELGVSFAHEPIGATDGMEVEVELFSEGGMVVLAKILD